MTVIAWDGKILAADRQAVCAGMRSIVKKIKATEKGEIIAFTGEYEQGLVLCEWYENGAKIENWPHFQRTENWTRLVIANIEDIETRPFSKNVLYVYEKEPLKIICEESFVAFGAGRDFAMGAMAQGASAIQAVEIANRFSIDCGYGIDYYNITDKILKVKNE